MSALVQVSCDVNTGGGSTVSCGCAYSLFLSVFISSVWLFSVQKDLVRSLHPFLHLQPLNLAVPVTGWTISVSTGLVLMILFVSGLAPKCHVNFPDFSLHIPSCLSGVNSFYICKKRTQSLWWGTSLRGGGGLGGGPPGKKITQ